MRRKQSASGRRRAGSYASGASLPRRSRLTRSSTPRRGYPGELYEGRGLNSMVVEALTRDTMPSGEGDLSIEGHGIEPIPAAARYGSVYRLFTVWFTPNLVPAAFALGALCAILGLGFVTGFLAIIVGNIIGGGDRRDPEHDGTEGRPRPDADHPPVVRQEHRRARPDQLAQHDRLGRDQRVLRRLCDPGDHRRRRPVLARPAGRHRLPGSPQRRRLRGDPHLREVRRHRPGDPVRGGHRSRSCRRRTSAWRAARRRSATSSC